MDRYRRRISRSRLGLVVRVVRLLVAGEKRRRVPTRNEGSSLSVALALAPEIERPLALAVPQALAGDIQSRAPGVAVGREGRSVGPEPALGEPPRPERVAAQ